MRPQGSAPRGFEVGETVGPYRIVGMLGAGGMAEVYRVEHTITHRIEAMKVLARAQPAGEQERQRFLREIQLQASLEHPNIAAVHNAFWDASQLVLVMELVLGDSLATLLGRGHVTPAAGIGYVRQILGALAYAHSRGVVHRDITPANIIITAQGIVKLTDFGLARQAADPALTQTGTLMGSPYYMSPEQIRGDNTPDRRSDMYSLGVVLYEMVTGRKPFAGDSAFSVMQCHVERVPQPPIEIQPRIGASLNEVILTALEKDPARRYPSAEAFRDALERAALDVRSARRPHPAAVLMFLLFALLAGALWWAHEAQPPEPKENPGWSAARLAVRIPAMARPVPPALPEPAPVSRAAAPAPTAARPPRLAATRTPTSAAASSFAEKKLRKRPNRVWRALGKILPPWR